MPIPCVAVLADDVLVLPLKRPSTGTSPALKASWAMMQRSPGRPPSGHPAGSQLDREAVSIGHVCGTGAVLATLQEPTALAQTSPRTRSRSDGSTSRKPKCDTPALSPGTPGLPTLSLIVSRGPGVRKRQDQARHGTSPPCRTPARRSGASAPCRLRPTGCQPFCLHHRRPPSGEDPAASCRVPLPKAYGRGLLRYCRVIANCRALSNPPCLLSPTARDRPGSRSRHRSRHRRERRECRGGPACRPFPLDRSGSIWS